MKFYSAIATFMLFANSAYTLTERDASIWWEKCLGESVSFETFQGWLGGTEAVSRQQLREHIKRCNYKSMLDVACGLCTDYWGLKIDQIDILYHGLDITPKLVELGIKNHIPVTLGSIEAIPFEDNSFELVSARHILEHLPRYEEALTEMVRVATKEAFVIFFMPPTDSPTHINLEYFLGSQIDKNGFKVYHNMYNIADLENFILKNPKVEQIEWDRLDTEAILHIYLQGCGDTRKSGGLSQCRAGERSEPG